MKIAVEVDVLVHYAKTGVHYYTQDLLKSAIKLDPHNSYELVYFGETADATSLGLPLDGVSLKPITGFPRQLYSLLIRAGLAPAIDRLAGSSGDVFVFPTFARWPLGRTKHSVTFIYDTVHADRPQDIKTRQFQYYLSRAVPKAVRRSTKVVAISDHTKQRLIDLYNCPADKITVINPAVDHTIYRPAEKPAIDRVKAKYGIKRDYILYLGTLEPRKNIVGILAAYGALPDQLRSKYQLVLAGGQGWGNDQIEAAAAKIAPDDLVRTGYVDEADKAALYSGATIFCFPSLFEGWGMPVVEAMACGVPVITADNSSLPEAGGKAAVYAQTDDQADLNRKLADLLADPDERARRSKLGLDQAKKFTWDKSARKLLDMFEAIDRT